MRVADVMTTSVRSVRAATSLKDAAALMTQHGVAGLPVVDGNGNILGVVSQRDVLRILGTDAQAAVVYEAMSSPAITIGPDAPVSEAALVMLERSINRLPVVAGGELVGIVSRSDLVRTYTRSDEEIEREIRDEILDDRMVADGGVSVEVDRGTVAVAGVVDTLDEARRLYRLLSRVPGVVSVRSTLSWRRDALGVG